MVHNYLIDFGSSMTIIPKKIVNVMLLECRRTSNGALQLDGTNIKIIGVVKDIGMILNKCPNISIIQDIIIVDLLSLFRIFLSKEFTYLLDGYLAMDYSHIMVACKDKKVKSFNESTSLVHVEKMHQINMIYYGAEGIDGLIEEVHIEDENTMNIMNSIDEVEPKNYVIIEPNTSLLSLAKHQLSGFEVWDMYFDGSRCKNGAEDGIVLKYPWEGINKFTFRFT